MIRIVIIPNSFEPKKNRVIKEVEWEGKKLHAYIPPMSTPIVALNQKHITDFDIIVPDNSEVIITPKQEGSIIGAIAGWIYTAFTGASIVGVGATGFTAGMALSYVAATAIVMAGSMLLSSALASGQSPNSSLQSIENSPTYSWSQASTLPRAGSPIPVLYGRHQLAGNIIQRRIEYIGDDEYLYLQLALCMGEIEDIYSGNIKINNTDITDYDNVEFMYTNGNTTQDVMQYFGDIESPNSFYSEFTDTSPIYKTTIGNSAEALRLFIQFPNGIYYSNDEGGLDSRTISFKVEYKKTSSSTWITHQQNDTRFDYWLYENKTSIWMEDNEHARYVCGLPITWDTFKSDNCYTGNKKAVYKTTNYNTWQFSAAKNTAVNREIRIDDLDIGEYDVRVTRLTSVSTNAREVTKSVWSGMGEIVKDDIYYPNVALLGVKIKASGQLSGDVDVLTVCERKDIKVYNESGVYQGYKSLDNPAWIYWDMLTNETYGYSLSYNQVDYTAIKEWADWCDEYVSNGIDGYAEKRATFNGVFDFDGNLWDSLCTVCTIGRASPIIRGTKYSVVVDKQADMVQIFNMGNIKKDTLKITYIGDEDLANEVEIQYVNKDNDYTNDTISVVVPEWFSTANQINKTTIQQMGITNESQAYRAGRYFLNNNKHIKRTAEFEASIDAIDSEVGDVIGISHDVPAWGESGRLESATTNTITIDKEVQLIGSQEYSITVRLNDNSFEKFDILFSETQATNTLTIDGSFTQIPSQYDIYSLIEKPSEIKLFRIVSITRKSDQTRKITAVEYNESIVTDSTTIISDQSTSQIDLYPTAYDVQIEEHLEKRGDGTIIPYVDFSWTAASSSFGSGRYAIYISSDDGETYTKIDEDISANSYSMMSLELQELKEYYFKISGKTIGVTYEPLQNIEATKYTYLGKRYPPSDVENFTVTQNGNFIDFSWTHISDLDKKGYEIRKGVTWDTGTPIGEIISTSTYSIQAEMNGTYEYHIKAIDTSSVYSLNSVSKVITLSNIDETVNAVTSGDENTSWYGLKTNFSYISGNLINTSSLTDNDVPSLLDTNEELTDYLGDRPLFCEYESEVLDTLLVGITKIRLLAENVSEFFNITDLIIANRLDIDYPLDTDLSITSEITKTIYFSTSEDGVTFEDYEEYTLMVDKTFRYAKIKVRFDFDIPNNRVELTSFKYVLDVPDISLKISDFPISATGEDILYSTYSKQFYKNTFIRATVLNSGANITPDITNKTLSGFHIDLYNSSDVKTSGSVDLEISGY